MLLRDNFSNGFSALGRFNNHAEKLCGRSFAELPFSVIKDIFEPGLHQSKDVVQQKLISIGGTLLNAYHFQPFNSLEEEVQQQQQQQQQ